MNPANESAAHESHHHPNYLAVWAVLVALLAVGVAAGYVGHPVLATVLVFGVAALKAGVVAANFMHLTREPLMVRLVVGGGLAIVVIALVGLIPDIVYVYGG